MRSIFLLVIAAALAAAPARAAYYEFTGTVSLKDASPFGSARFLPEGVGVSGSGIAESSNSPPLRHIHGFADVQGFTGSLMTAFASTAGYSQMAFLSGVGPQDFTTNTVGQPRLHGKLAVRGLAERNDAAFRLTVGMSKGLGLGGTVMATSGTFPSVRFGTWTTGTVSEPAVVVESHPAMGTSLYGNVTGMGFDNRTSMGMGTVQFVTPIRTVSQPPICPVPPCAPIPGKHGAIAVLTLTFAPEPGRAALLSAASCALALLGVRRARARRARC